MIESLRIAGFRALRDTTIKFAHEAPTLVIGENGSGKSSLIEALGVLSAFIHGTGGDALAARGGWNAVAWAGIAPEITFCVRFSRGSRFFPEESGTVEYELVVGHERGVPLVLREQLRIHKDARQGGQGPLVVLQGGAKAFARNAQTHTNDPIEPGGSHRIRRNTAVAVIREADADRYPTALDLRRALQNIAIYAGFPALQRTQANPSPFMAHLEEVPRITSSGADLVNALYTIRENHSTVWSELLRDLQAVFPWCEELSAPPVSASKGALTLRWRDARSSTMLYLDDMSDGMRVYLATLAALYAPDEPAILAFDEPEKSLHPTALRRLVAAIEQRALRTPVLLATHSDRLLDFLEFPERTLRVARFDSEAGVTLEQPDPGLLEAWLKQYSLGELRARRLLDGPREEF